MLDTIRTLYQGDTPAANRFRYGVLIFDMITILFVVLTSFFKHTPLIEALDAVFGVLILTDFAIRVWLEADRGRFLLRPATWADIVAVLSFLAPVAGEGFGFLRILRTLRLLQTYHLLVRLRADFKWFRDHESLVLASVNLFVFIFVMTGIIYVLQVGVNPQIQNYVDALYFTMTTLTTTGFGDITLTGSGGRMLSVVVMIFGVTLFLRLLQVLLRPPKVKCECRECGLYLHDADATHCKHCGTTIHIRTEGGV